MVPSSLIYINNHESHTTTWLPMDACRPQLPGLPGPMRLITDSHPAAQDWRWTWVASGKQQMQGMRFPGGKLCHGSEKG